MANPHELSQAAHDRLVAELEELRTHGRIELADKIERAREHGDLKENAEYHAAKEEKAKMEGRIAKLFGILEDADDRRLRAVPSTRRWRARSSRCGTRTTTRTRPSAT